MLGGRGHSSVSIDPTAGGVVLMVAGSTVLGCRRLICGATGVAPGRFWSGVLVVPVLLVNAVGLGATGVALDLRWRGSESAFQSEVSSLQRGGSVPTPLQIGSYTIT